MKPLNSGRRSGASFLPQRSMEALAATLFSELQSHYLFADRFGRPGKGNDKRKLVGYARRNFLVPIPVFADFEALNAHLLDSCRKRLADRLRGHDGTIGDRLERDLAAFQTPLPAPYDACDKKPGRVSSLSATDDTDVSEAEEVPNVPAPGPVQKKRIPAPKQPVVPSSVYDPIKTHHPAIQRRPYLDATGSVLCLPKGSGG
jgi:hypothetical protein